MVTMERYVMDVSVPMTLSDLRNGFQGHDVFEFAYLKNAAF